MLKMYTTNPKSKMKITKYPIKKYSKSTKKETKSLPRKLWGVMCIFIKLICVHGFMVYLYIKNYQLPL